MEAAGAAAQDGGTLQNAHAVCGAVSVEYEVRGAKEKTEHHEIDEREWGAGWWLNGRLINAGWGRPLRIE